VWLSPVDDHDAADKLIFASTNRKLKADGVVGRRKASMRSLPGNAVKLSSPGVPNRWSSD